MLFAFFLGIANALNLNFGWWLNQPENSEQEAPISYPSMWLELTETPVNHTSKKVYEAEISLHVYVEDYRGNDEGMSALQALVEQIEAKITGYIPVKNGTMLGFTLSRIEYSTQTNALFSARLTTKCLLRK